ncbi:MAG TPA: glutathione-disulfide reductase [Geminicoccus sp.]|uniref:glutathione-disulfide reductase n=1 Tax=Geminicoccus sp. TaxID=2024832 RepID=UPI002E302770|nr:glutathione-disulfide reductase [Geminicoccus sp.]HEX2525687.1 glutathione-disulfide reductase [Geminicoccus sp.]
MIDRLDLFVIGGGSGGVACARRAASYGAKVALAEDSRLGGTCVIRGCVPKKLMHYGAGVPHELDVARDMGWSFGEVRHDFRFFLEARNREIARLEDIYQGLLDRSGVRVVKARARVAGRDGEDFVVEAGQERFRTRRVMIATGGTPYVPDLPGIEHVVTSDHVLEDVYDRPGRVAVIGAGYIGVELGCVFHGFGAKTTLILRGDAPLRGFDEDLRHQLNQQIAESGVEIMPRSVVTSIERTADGLVLHGLERSVTADLVLYATGRRPQPRTSGIGLEALGIEMDYEGAILVDETYTSNVPGLLAVGDCSDHAGHGLDSGQHDLTPVAIAEGRAVAERFFNNRIQRVRYDTIATAIFSSPEAAACGMTEVRARAEGHDVLIFKANFRPMRTTMGQHAHRTFMKLVVDKHTDKVLGCHLVGPDTPEIIQMVAAAMTAGATKADFDDTVAVHPTAAEELVTMYQPVQD